MRCCIFDIMIGNLIKCYTYGGIARVVNQVFFYCPRTQIILFYYICEFYILIDPLFHIESKNVKTIYYHKNYHTGLL